MTRLLAPFIMVALVLPGCARPMYFPDRAADPYPRHIHSTVTTDIQVFREGTKIELVNATPHSYSDFNLWVNRRYVKRIDTLPAGSRRTFSLWDFYDERGETLNAGGFWRIYEPDPVRLVQIQIDDDSPMIGLIAVREYRHMER